MQRTLLSSNALANVLLAVFIVGALLFVLGTMLARERQARTIESQPIAPLSETKAEPVLDVAGRLDLVERLVMVGQTWCIEQLDTIRREDPNESVREAADAALMVIGSRSHLSS